MISMYAALLPPARGRAAARAVRIALAIAVRAATASAVSPLAALRPIFGVEISACMPRSRCVQAHRRSGGTPMKTWGGARA